ncbi:hypothetical protein N643_15475 [Salmonella bongori serovar 48:z41:-- str. RKS3044]|nr:hypothetical protein N643_15475 [Salmonella bongori serovar 48:z41:-- str. RKS3044]
MQSDVIRMLGAHKNDTGNILVLKMTLAGKI